MVEIADKMGPVLIVEDDPDIRDVLAEHLMDVGFRVETAVDGKDAMEKLARLPRPCSMVLDVMMPRVSGPELLAWMERDPDLARTPVFLVTASTAQIESPLVVRRFSKPFEIEDLFHAVDQLCPRW